MPNIEHNIFEYHLEPIETIKAALARIEDDYEILRGGGPIMERIYRYIFKINEELYRQPENDALVLAHRGIIQFLRPEVIDALRTNPGDKITRDEASFHLAMVGAAATLVPDVVPYDTIELQLVVKGDKNLYNPTIILSTLHHLMHGGNSAEDAEVTKVYAQIVVGSLFPAQSQGEVVEYGWIEALVYSTVLQAVWCNFSLLTPDRQQFLLQNYYYQAIVNGVPVREHLKNFLLSSPNKEAAEAVFERSIENNREVVPVKIGGTEGRLFVEVLKEYIAALYSGTISTLAQEKVLLNFYKGQEGVEIYTAWLREAFGIYYHLKRRDFLRS